jgi:hypothetical protein
LLSALGTPVTGQQQTRPLFDHLVGAGEQDEFVLAAIAQNLRRLPFTDYTEYLQCQSSLTSALSLWDVDM